MHLKEELGISIWHEAAYGAYHLLSKNPEGLQSQSKLGMRRAGA